MGEIIRTQEQLESEAAERDPKFKAILEKRDSLVERAAFNEAIRVIDELLTEVDSMPVAQRFSRTRKMEENKMRGSTMMPHYEEMTEVDFKRQQLKRDLNRIKQTIIESVTRLQTVVMDMEATKIE